MTEDTDTAPCIGCGKWLPDHDGIGVVAHVFPEQVSPELRSSVEFDADPCGYCRHLSRDGEPNGVWWKCCVCGHKRADDGRTIPSFIMFSGNTRCEYKSLGAKCGAAADFVLYTSDGKRTAIARVGDAIEPPWGFGVVCATHGDVVVSAHQLIGVEIHLVTAVIR